MGQKQQRRDSTQHARELVKASDDSDSPSLELKEQQPLETKSDAMDVDGASKTKSNARAELEEKKVSDDYDMTG